MSTLDLCNCIISFEDAAVLNDFFSNTFSYNVKHQAFIKYIIEQIDECLMLQNYYISCGQTYIIGQGTYGIVFGQCITNNTTRKETKIAIKLDMHAFQENPAADMNSDECVQQLLYGIRLHKRLGDDSIALEPLFVKQMKILENGVKQTDIPSPMPPSDYTKYYYGLLNITITQLADMDGNVLLKKHIQSPEDMKKYISKMTMCLNFLVNASSCVDLKPKNFLYIASEDKVYASDFDYHFCQHISTTAANEEIFKGMQLFVFFLEIMSFMFRHKLSNTSILTPLLVNDYLQLVLTDIQTNDSKEFNHFYYTYEPLKDTIEAYAPFYLKTNNVLQVDKLKSWFVELCQEPQSLYDTIIKNGTYIPPPSTPISL